MKLKWLQIPPPSPLQNDHPIELWSFSNDLGYILTRTDEHLRWYNISTKGTGLVIKGGLSHNIANQYDNIVHQ